MVNTILLERWLKRVGFIKGNPFAIHAADQEPFVPECFVDPGLYDAVKNERRAALIFAPQGSGKTALRVMLSSDCRPLQPSDASPRSRTLSITYSDFDPALEACKGDLKHLTAIHHLNKILSDGCAILLEALWQDNKLVEALTPDNISWLARYCQNFNPTLLDAEYVYTHVQFAFPEIEISWSDLELAIMEKQLVSYLRAKIGKLPSTIQLQAALVDQRCKPLTNTSSSIKLLSQFAKVVQGTGLQELFILVDRLDEHPKTIANPDYVANLITPLISNSGLMEIEGVKFRLFIPEESRSNITPYLRDKNHGQFSVTWDHAKMSELMQLRLRVYSDDKIQSLGKLCDDTLASHIEEEMIDLSDGSPRRLMQLGAALFEAQATTPSPDGLINGSIWKQVPEKVLGQGYVRPLRIDRQGAQVYIGRTTVVQLAPIPYRLIVYLYENAGFRTNEEIKAGVWPDEKYVTDDMVRQTIHRVRKAITDANGIAEDYVLTQPGRGYKLLNTAQ